MIYESYLAPKSVGVEKRWACPMTPTITAAPSSGLTKAILKKNPKYKDKTFKWRDPLSKH